MMATVQGGCFPRYKTMKALREGLAAGHKIRLFGTSPFGPQYEGPPQEMPKDMEFIVVGPDPYNDRRWYASVKWNKKGVVSVA